MVPRIAVAAGARPPIRQWETNPSVFSHCKIPASVVTFDGTMARRSCSHWRTAISDRCFAGKVGDPVPVATALTAIASAAVHCIEHTTAVAVATAATATADVMGCYYDS